MLQPLDKTAAHDTAGSGTEAIIALVKDLNWAALDRDVKHAAKRHFLDTLGVIIAGASGDLAGKAEAVLAKVRGAGRIPVPGRSRRADLLDAAYIAGTAGHGIELDDGYRQGSVHPGVATIPAILGLGYEAGVSGRQALEAVIIGYETIIAVARACHPDLRQRGFHPTGATGVFGAATASARLLDLSPVQVSNALGIAAEHAHTGWQDYASAQLSFPYIMAIGMRHGWIKVEHFEDKERGDPEMARLAGLVHVKGTAEMDGLYPANRPARVTITTDRGKFEKEAMEALGAREVPLDDARLGDKFRDLVDPVLGKERAIKLLDALWRLDELDNIKSLLDSTVR